MSASYWSSSSGTPVNAAGRIVRKRVELGAVVGERYRLLELIGSGGMGAVYAAQDEKRDRRVALKLMHAHLGRLNEAHRRFLNEASALHRVRSDHVARLYDFGRHADGAPYLVMEHVPGHDLTQELAVRGRLSWSEALAIIDQVCAALEDVHTAGLIHRDLKPRNIMVGRGEGGLQCKVIDFGLSKSSRPSRSGVAITREGMAVGSLHYMAPEQAIGSTRVDARADVFSVGCILYYLLTGEPPFTQRSLARAGRNGSALLFNSIHARRRDVPGYVEEVLRVALAPDPDQRFRTIGALRIALQSDIPSLGGEAVIPTGAVTVRAVPRPFWLTRWVMLSTMLVALASYWWWRR